MGKETVLPKNIRQIGDIQGKDKICIEDYVMTYIRKKEPQEDKGFLGVFLGEKKETEENCYLFIRGILELAQEEEAETVKELFEKQRLEYFPGWEVMGCCVIGTYPTKRMEQLAEIAPVARHLIYHYQEQEENLYLMTEESYRKLGGYLVFYEQNRKMQDYLAEVFGKDSVEKESLPDKAIKSFRDKVKEKGEQKSRSVLKLAGSFFVVTVLAIGAIVVNRIDDLGFSRSKDTISGRTEEAAPVAVYVSQQEGETAAGSQSTSSQSASAAQGTTVSQTTDTANQSISSQAVSAAQSTTVSQTTDTVNQSTSSQSASAAQSTAASQTTDTVNQSTSSQSASAAQSTTVLQTAETSGQTTEATESSETWMKGSDAFWEETESGAGDLGETQEESDGENKDETAQSTSETESSEAASRKTQAAYVIKEGDTLAMICKKYYGNMERLEEICEANDIADANMILPGQKIVLP
jgi:nucleoid-associated protein YgaU